jgi:hypothetical protein
MAFVFQYGSNLSTERLNKADRLNGDAKVVGVALTEKNFELTFHIWSGKATPPCAAANIVHGSGRRIWGVIYDIPDELITREKAKPHNRRSLDGIEGDKYERVSINLRWADDRPVSDRVITYVGRATEIKNGIQTSFEYVKHILKGLEEHQMPGEYVAYVKARILANNPRLREQLFRNIFQSWLYLGRRLCSRIFRHLF